MAEKHSTIQRHDTTPDAVVRADTLRELAMTRRDARTVARAISIIERGAKAANAPFVRNPCIAKQLFQLHLGGGEKEEFLAAWLDAQHRLITMETLAIGTLTQTTVYPREVVKSALAHNAAAVIFGHNHPSGSTTPSDADWSLTSQLRDSLRLVDVSVLDHLVVTVERVLSMEEYAPDAARLSGCTVVAPSGTCHSPPPPTLPKKTSKSSVRSRDSKRRGAKHTKTN